MFWENDQNENIPEIKLPLLCEWKYLFQFGCELFNLQAKFRFSEKATKFEKKNSHLFWHLHSKAKTSEKIFKTCEAFSDNLSFKQNSLFSDKTNI